MAALRGPKSHHSTLWDLSRADLFVTSSEDKGAPTL